MKIKILLQASSFICCGLSNSIVGAQQPDPELQKAMEFFSTAGIPGDEWIEIKTTGDQDVL